MNLKTARLLRKAVDYRRGTTKYEPAAMHHWTEYPTAETYTAVLKDGTTEQRRKYKVDGKTPVWQMIYNVEAGAYQVATSLVPVVKPRRLLKGSTRAIYKLLKRLERTLGLDEAFKRAAGATA